MWCGNIVEGSMVICSVVVGDGDYCGGVVGGVAC